MADQTATLEESQNYVRPMSARALFAAAWALYRRFFGRLFAINLFFVAATLAAQMLSLPPVMGISLQGIFNWAVLVVQMFVIAATVIATSNSVVGRPVKVLGSFQRALAPGYIIELLILSIPAILWTQAYDRLVEGMRLLMGRVQAGSMTAVQFFLSSLVSVVALILLRLVIEVILLYGPAVTVLEKAGPLGTVRRVVELFWFSAGRVLVNYGLLWAIPLWILHFVLYLPIALTLAVIQLGRAGFSPEHIYTIGMSVGTTTSLLVNAAITLFLNPFTYLLFTLLYYDTRARKEAYNDELLAEDLGYRPVAEMMSV